jgi:hypothetical protein
MPSEKQQPSQIGELLSDIRYVNQISREEIERSADRLRQSISEADLPTPVANSLINEISTQLGEQTAKVTLTEKMVRSLGVKSQPVKEEKKIHVMEAGITEPTGLRITAKQLAGNTNLYPVETSTNGISFLWSGTEPEVHFSFSLDRSKPLEMQIRLFALIKWQYSRRLRVLIDGETVKHRIHRKNKIYVIRCRIPAVTIERPTRITITLPATHSPRELGRSHDARKLGMAINEIRFYEPESGFNDIRGLLKR